MIFKNPKPTTNVIIVNETRTMICVTQRTIEPFYGRVVLPGGYVNEGERVEDAALREAKEETGLDIKLLTILGVYSAPDRNPQNHTISTVFIAKAVGGALQKNDEAIPYWVFLKEVPDLAFDHNEIIAHFKQWCKNKEKTFWSSSL